MYTHIVGLTAPASVELLHRDSLSAAANMKLGYVIIYVKSVPATLKFYQNAFKIPARFGGDDYAELALDGSTTLAFANEKFVEESIGANVFRKNSMENDTSAGAEISFLVDAEAGETVESSVEQAVQAGATLVKEAMTKPWGQTVAYVKDCNGFLVEICTPVEPQA